MLITDNRLTKPQRIFLDKASAFSWYLSEQLRRKEQFFRGKDLEISSTLLLAEMILKSNWGQHPISQVKFNGKWANNLVLLLNDSQWAGKTAQLDNNTYKTFTNWETFGTHWTDTLIFYKTSNIEKYMYERLQDKCYDKDVQELLSLYKLEEFEIVQRF